MCLILFFKPWPRCHPSIWSSSSGQFLWETTGLCVKPPPCRGWWLWEKLMNPWHHHVLACRSPLYIGSRWCSSRDLVCCRFRSLRLWMWMVSIASMVGMHVVRITHEQKLKFLIFRKNEIRTCQVPCKGERAAVHQHASSVPLAHCCRSPPFILLYVLKPRSCDSFTTCV